MKSRVAFCVVLAGMLLATLAAPQTAYAAATITLAELNNGQLRIEGTGAVPNSGVTVDGGVARGVADASGSFRIEASNFSEPSCIATLYDGSVSVQATLTGCTATASPPPAPPPALTLAGPASGASIVQPFALSWLAPADTTGLSDYRWQVATSSTFSPLTLNGLPGPSATQTPSLSGLFNGTYFWRVQAIRSAPSPTAFLYGAWSEVRSFTITGSAPGTPATPTLTPPTQSAYHPLESFPLSWTAVANAASYRVEMVRDASFAPDTHLIDTTVSGTTFTSPLFGFETPLIIRVRGVSASGIQGLPSAPVSVQITYTAPIPPPPNLLAPADGATVSLPLTFSWSDDPNPQTGGYELQVSADSAFTGGCGTVELCVTGITPSQYTLNSLSSGTKYWRVRSYHGASAPGVAAVTAWSAVRSFSLPAAPPSLLSFTIDVYGGGGLFIKSHTNAFSGTTGDNLVYGDIQLSGPAPAGGTVVTLSSSDPTVASVPASITVAAGVATASFRIEPLQVTVSTTVTLTASLGAKTLSAPLTVDPPNIKQVDIGVGPPVQNVFSGGATEVGTVIFNGVAPNGSVIALSSSSPAVSVPASITIGGLGSASFTITTSQVTATTNATITATWKGQSVPVSLTLQPPPMLVGPAAGATFATGQAVTFSWNALAGLAAYNIQIGSSSSFPAPLLLDQNTSTLTQFSSSTLPSGTLFWRVRALDVYGSPGPWSAVRSITVTPPAGPLPAPSLGFPADGAVLSAGQTVAFTWSSVAGAASYTLQIANSPDFTSPLILNQTVVGSTQFSTSTLPTTKMWWRVQAIDSAGNPGAWSTVRQLEVK